MNHLSTLVSISYRLLGNIGTSLAEGECLTGIQHTAICITTSVNQVVLCLLSGSAEHGRSLEPVSKHSLRNLRTEVAEVNNEGVTSSLLHILQCLLGVNLTFYDADRTLIDAFLTVLFLIRSDNSLTTVNSQ